MVLCTWPDSPGSPALCPEPSNCSDRIIGGLQAPSCRNVLQLGLSRTQPSPLPSHSLWLGSLVPFCERPLTSCGPRPFLPWLSDPHLHGDFCAESWSVFLAAPLGLPCSHQFLLQELVGSHKGPAWPFLSSVLLGFFFRLCVHPHQTVSFRSLPFPLILLQAWVGSKHSFC